ARAPRASHGLASAPVSWPAKAGGQEVPVLGCGFMTEALTAALRGRHDRQVDGEDRAYAQLALDLERAAVMADNVLDDSKAEAGSAQLARARRIDAVETLGEPRQIVARNAGAGILDRDRERRAALRAARHGKAARGRLGGNHDRRAGCAIFDRVVEKV